MPVWLLTKKEMQAAYNYVALVDCGDSVQGDVIGTLSKGEYLVDIMNEVGYDFASFGNHEFDYTLPQLQKLIDKAKYQYLCCNLTYTGKDGKGLTGYKAYEIKTYGDIKVAFVGIDTPESFTKSTPTYFRDANGNFVYSFAEGNKGADLYNKVQETVDAAKKDGATYVVALAHLGVDESSEPWRSTDLIANTTGIDAVLDGHSHSTIAMELVKNKDGKEIPPVLHGHEARQHRQADHLQRRVHHGACLRLRRQGRYGRRVCQVHSGKE